MGDCNMQGFLDAVGEIYRNVLKFEAFKENCEVVQQEWPALPSAATVTVSLIGALIGWRMRRAPLVAAAEGRVFAW